MRYREAFLRKLPQIQENRCGKALFLWGAGTGAAVLLPLLQEAGISVDGIVDKNAGEISAPFHRYHVQHPSVLSVGTHYVLIDMLSSCPEVVDELTARGFTDSDFCYVYQLVHTEDIVYRGCRVGRFTYGYEDLLADYPLAESIGRDCSIKCTARILNNHYMECNKTNTLLD